ncbi:protein phosphatase 2C domain-containing protein [Streptomyces sp. NPDC004111]|uniref:protein phosphatase 2C domain-containing protein n=1 Tax=Streptomyces sp. NPDC004111 TaxID=3364690 RepID=UPI0036B78A1D
MSQQGDRRQDAEDDWWDRLYDESTPDTGPEPSGKTLDDHFDSTPSAPSKRDARLPRDPATHPAADPAGGPAAYEVPFTEPELPPPPPAPDTFPVWDTGQGPAAWDATGDTWSTGPDAPRSADRGRAWDASRAGSVEPDREPARDPAGDDGAAGDPGRDPDRDLERDPVWDAALNPWNADRTPDPDPDQAPAPDPYPAPAPDQGRDAAGGADEDSAWNTPRDSAWNTARDAAWDTTAAPDATKSVDLNGNWESGTGATSVSPSGAEGSRGEYSPAPWEPPVPESPPPAFAPDPRTGPRTEPPSAPPRSEPRQDPRAEARPDPRAETGEPSRTTTRQWDSWLPTPRRRTGAGRGGDAPAGPSGPSGTAPGTPSEREPAGPAADAAGAPRGELPDDRSDRVPGPASGGAAEGAQDAADLAAERTAEWSAPPPAPPGPPGVPGPRAGGGRRTRRLWDEPTERTEPSARTERAPHTESTERGGPTGPAVPTDPAVPTEPAVPNGSSEPATRTEGGEPTGTAPAPTDAATGPAQPSGRTETRAENRTETRTEAHLRDVPPLPTSFPAWDEGAAGGEAQPPPPAPTAPPVQPPPPAPAAPPDAEQQQTAPAGPARPAPPPRERTRTAEWKAPQATEPAVVLTPRPASAHVGDGPPTYDAEPTALAAADPADLGGLVPDTVLDGARYGSYTLRAASVRGDSARYRGEPRRDALLTARFGDGAQGLVLVAVASGARATEGAHLAAADACRWIAGAVGRSHSRLAEDIRAGRRGDLKSGLHRLTDRAFGKLRARAAELGVEAGEYTAGLRCLLLSADPDCRTRIFFGVGEGGLLRLRDGVWQDIEPPEPRPDAVAGAPVVGFGAVPADSTAPDGGGAAAEAGDEPEESAQGDRLTMDLGITTPPSPHVDTVPPGSLFRFRASVARSGDTLLLCSAGLAEPLRGESALADELAARWAGQDPPGLTAFLADVTLRAKGYADDRTAVAAWEL